MPATISSTAAAIAASIHAKSMSLISSAHDSSSIPAHDLSPVSDPLTSTSATASASPSASSRSSLLIALQRTGRARPTATVMQLAASRRTSKKQHRSGDTTTTKTPEKLVAWRKAHAERSARNQEEYESNAARVEELFNGDWVAWKEYQTRLQQRHRNIFSSIQAGEAQNLASSAVTASIPEQATPFSQVSAHGSTLLPSPSTEHNSSVHPLVSQDLSSASSHVQPSVLPARPRSWGPAEALHTHVHDDSDPAELQEPTFTAHASMQTRAGGLPGDDLEARSISSDTSEDRNSVQSARSAQSQRLRTTSAEDQLELLHRVECALRSASGQSIDDAGLTVLQQEKTTQLASSSPVNIDHAFDALSIYPPEGKDPEEFYAELMSVTSRFSKHRLSELETEVSVEQPKHSTAGSDSEEGSSPKRVLSGFGGYRSDERSHLVREGLEQSPGSQETKGKKKKGKKRKKKKKGAKGGTSPLEGAANLLDDPTGKISDASAVIQGDAGKATDTAPVHSDAGSGTESCLPLAHTHEITLTPKNTSVGDDPGFTRTRRELSPIKKRSSPSPSQGPFSELEHDPADKVPISILSQKAANRKAHQGAGAQIVANGAKSPPSCSRPTKHNTTKAHGDSGLAFGQCLTSAADHTTQASTSNPQPFAPSLPRDIDLFAYDKAVDDARSYLFSEVGLTTSSTCSDVESCIEDTHAPSSGLGIFPSSEKLFTPPLLNTQPRDRLSKAAPKSVAPLDLFETSSELSSSALEGFTQEEPGASIEKTLSWRRTLAVQPSVRAVSSPSPVYNDAAASSASSQVPFRFPSVDCIDGLVVSESDPSSDAVEPDGQIGLDNAFMETSIPDFYNDARVRTGRPISATNTMESLDGQERQAVQDFFRLSDAVWRGQLGDDLNDTTREDFRSRNAVSDHSAAWMMDRPPMSDPLLESLREPTASALSLLHSDRGALSPGQAASPHSGSRQTHPQHQWLAAHDAYWPASEPASQSFDRFFDIESFPYPSVHAGSETDSRSRLGQPGTDAWLGLEDTRSRLFPSQSLVRPTANIGAMAQHASNPLYCAALQTQVTRHVTAEHLRASGAQASLASALRQHGQVYGDTGRNLFVPVHQLTPYSSMQPRTVPSSSFELDRDAASFRPRSTSTPSWSDW